MATIQVHSGCLLSTTYFKPVFKAYEQHDLDITTRFLARRILSETKNSSGRPITQPEIGELLSQSKKPGNLDHLANQVYLHYLDRRVSRSLNALGVDTCARVDLDKLAEYSTILCKSSEKKKLLYHEGTDKKELELQLKKDPRRNVAASFASLCEIQMNAYRGKVLPEDTLDPDIHCLDLARRVRTVSALFYSNLEMLDDELPLKQKLGTETVISSDLFQFCLKVMQNGLPQPVDAPCVYEEFTYTKFAFDSDVYVLKTFEYRKDLQCLAKEHPPESFLLHKLNHPNVQKFVCVPGRLTESSNEYNFIAKSPKIGHFALALLDGNIPMNFRIFSRLCIDWLEGLSYLHEQGIVHRAVSGYSLQVDLDEVGNFKGVITDFQLATQASFTKHSEGNYPFISPEAARGDHQHFSSDIWLFGLALYSSLFNDVNFYDFTMEQILGVGDALREFCDLKNAQKMNAYVKRKINKALKTPENKNILKLIGPRNEIVSIIKRCLDLRPDQRPAANDLLMQLKAYSERETRQLRQKKRKDFSSSASLNKQK